MAELILSEQEKKQTWAEADELALGKAVKYVAFQLGLADTNDTYAPAILTATAQTLIALARAANADTLTTELNGVKHKNEDIGDWTITVKQTKKRHLNEGTLASVLKAMSDNMPDETEGESNEGEK